MKHRLVNRAAAFAVGTLIFVAGATLADPASNPTAGSSASPTGRRSNGVVGEPVPATPEQIETMKEIVTLDAAAEAALNKTDYAAAEAKAREALALGQGIGWSEEDLAAALYGEGKTREALQEYQKLNDPAPQAASCAFPYALLLLQSGQWAKAVDAYNKALASGGDVKLLRADSLFLPNVPQPAELKAAILIGWAINPSGGAFHGTYNQINQQAQAMFEEAAKLAPDSAVAKYYIGYGLERMGKRDEAQAAYKKAASMGNSDVQACVKAGTVSGGMSQVLTGH